MGLLTDPNIHQDGLSKFLLKYGDYLSFLSYVLGIVWFLSLSHNNFNAETYISENALLPAMVEREFNMEKETLNYLENLKEEMDRYENEMPTAWLQGQFRQLGLEVYMHNFTFNPPFAKQTKFQGKNIYAIMRAPRAASTEALVLSVPFRSPISAHKDTSPGIALMLALAKFFRQRSFWAKDLIFLITEHEQLGAKAWLEAYHEVESPGKILNFGVLPSRSGAIQAAINIEIQDKFTSSLNIKIEGLTGQLPNLDLFNLAVRLCLRENVRVTFKERGKFGKTNSWQEWRNNFQTTMAMVKSQATGVPTGNHGLFLRYNIESITLEGLQADRTKRISIHHVGRVVEGIFRSLNNLLESLHQSYFFYLLPSVDRYVSIGLYMPPLGLILLPLILTIVKLQITSQRDIWLEESQQKSTNYSTIILYVLICHSFGFGLVWAQPTFNYLGKIFNLFTENALFFANLIAFFFSLFLPSVMNWISSKSEKTTGDTLKMFSLMEAALLFGAISLANYSLAFLISIVAVPILICIAPTTSKWRKRFGSLFLIVISPMILSLIFIFHDTIINFPEDGIKDLLPRTLNASKRALFYAVTDWYIYNNWMFQIVTVFYFPMWIQMWSTQHYHIKTKQD